ncbi:MAG TPA: FUSC family protein, partial [Trebonia sp.]|nr:FUSC family protein [Trebonia sp.]
TFAYLLALVVPAGTDRPVLAPLTALLVLQASLFQTIRSGIKKVISVLAGVLAAVTLSAFVGFSWWLLALLIAGALLLGLLLRLGDDLLEVPISAMLIFASAGEHAAASGRVVDTLVGTAAGLAGGLIFAPLRTQPAREAVSELAGRLAGLLDGMAADLAGLPDGDAPDPDRVVQWLDQGRALRSEIERVDDLLRQAEDAARLNPRTLHAPGTQPATEVALRGGLETLEHAAVTLRVLARSVLDSSRIPSAASPVRDEQTRARLAGVLTQLGEAIRAYGRLVQTPPAEAEPLASELAARLEDAHRQQDELAAILEPRTAPEGGSTEWPLRGEILSHVDRLRTGLDVDLGELAMPPARPRVRPRRRARRPARESRREGRRENRRENRAARQHAGPGPRRRLHRQVLKVMRPRDMTPTR